MTDHNQGHDCCACVDRLREQNKASADEAHRRSAKVQSELDGLRWLMDQAAASNRQRVAANGIVADGLSLYGQAALAAAFREADEARAEADMLRASFHRERRARLALVDQVARSHRVKAEMGEP